MPARAPIESLPAALRPGSDAIRRLASLHRLSLVVLFGSRARGAARRESDFDIAVLTDDARTRRPFPLTADEAQAFRRLHADLQRLLGTSRIDLVLLHRASPLLAHRIARDGIPLYEASPGTFARFCVRAVQRLDDMRPMLRAERLYLARAFGACAPHPELMG